MYSNIRSRAGLVVFVFALIIRVASAAPIPTLAPHSGLPVTLSSLSNRYGQDHFQRDTGGIDSPIISTVSATTGANNILFEEDNELVARRIHISNKIKKAFQNFGHKVKNAFKDFGHKTKKAFQKFGEKTKKAFKFVGKKLKEGFKVIAKVGLAIVSGMQKVGSYIVKFIPGIGGVLSKGLKMASKMTGKISQAIHAHVGGKLGIAVNVLNHLNKLPG